MWTYEDWMEQRRTRYELVSTRNGLWCVHDRQEHTYTLGMTMDEAVHYLRREGANPEEVPIMN